MNTYSATRPPYNRLRRYMGILFTCTLAGALFSPPVLSQQALRQFDEGSPEQWYQVEVIIFTQSGNTPEGEEVWRTDIDLDYPLNWLELLSPAQLSALADEESVPDGENALNADAVALDITTGEPASRAINDSASITQRNTVTGTKDIRNGSVVDPSQAIAERSLLLLPKEELTLSDQARRLSRNRQHRILFHGAWRQAMKENRQEPSILISGGELFDEHHELEGSINFYRRTYLHIETDLWLSQFATNFGQERQPWPKLPTPPNRPAELNDMIRIDDGGTGLWHQFTQESNEYDAILAEPYVPENIVIMQQGRRMRSSELHYIDHPKMGLLVKLSPYEVPEEEEEGEQRELNR